MIILSASKKIIMTIILGNSGTWQHSEDLTKITVTAENIKDQIYSFPPPFFPSFGSSLAHTQTWTPIMDKWLPVPTLSLQDVEPPRGLGSAPFPSPCISLSWHVRFGLLVLYSCCKGSDPLSWNLFSFLCLRKHPHGDETKISASLYSWRLFTSVSLVPSYSVSLPLFASSSVGGARTVPATLHQRRKQ